jgi:transposase-like protein
MAMTVPNVKRATAMPIVQERILPRSTVYTDYYHVYRTLPQMGYSHARINHSERVYVSGDVHTNTIEGFWSLVKRGLDGVFHGVSKKRLQGYLNEYVWRYNQAPPRARPISSATSSVDVPLISPVRRLSSDCRRSRRASELEFQRPCVSSEFWPWFIRSKGFIRSEVLYGVSAVVSAMSKRRTR